MTSQASRHKDRTGDRVGMLTAIRPAGLSDRKEMWWVYKCDCGSETTHYPHTAKRNGHCGCQTKERMRNRSRAHGQSQTRVYKAWAAMVYRCHQPSHRSFSHYGGRGISVCERWRESFENFIADMGSRPEGMTIERIDNNGNYEPGNCVWASRKTQQRNRRVCVAIEIDGKSRCLAEWCEMSGINRQTVVGRLAHGWDAKRAIFTPAKTKMRNRNAKETRSGKF